MCEQCTFCKSGHIYGIYMRGQLCSVHMYVDISCLYTRDCINFICIYTVYLHTYNKYTYIPEHEITVGHLTFFDHFWC